MRPHIENALLAIRLAKRRLFDAVRRASRRLRGQKNTQKVFCIGRGKTGTTSMEQALKDLGYHMGDQLEATLLYEAHYFEREFGQLIDYCRKFEAFQDLPFSAPHTFKVLDEAFPGSKFILTIRDTPEQWYNSTLRFQAKMKGKGQVPTYAQLEKSRYIRTGYATHIVRLNNTTKEDPFNKDRMIAGYEAHNQDVRDYFKERPKDLLVLNVAEKGALQKLASFLGKQASATEFPWQNKT